MSIHDRLTGMALRDGNTSEEFRSAAQKHANATWFCLIIAVAVWYFTNWKWALIPSVASMFVALQSISATLVARKLENRKARKATITIPEAEHIIDIVSEALIRNGDSNHIDKKKGQFSRYYEPVSVLQGHDVFQIDIALKLQLAKFT